jgi:hypothetical protein
MMERGERRAVAGSLLPSCLKDRPARVFMYGWAEAAEGNRGSCTTDAYACDNTACCSLPGKCTGKSGDVEYAVRCIAFRELVLLDARGSRILLPPLPLQPPSSSSSSSQSSC